jgi:hypothetical protein
MLRDELPGFARQRRKRSDVVEQDVAARLIPFRLGLQWRRLGEWVAVVIEVDPLDRMALIVHIDRWRHYCATQP